MQRDKAWINQVISNSINTKELLLLMPQQGREREREREREETEYKWP